MIKNNIQGEKIWQIISNNQHNIAYLGINGDILLIHSNLSGFPTGNEDSENGYEKHKEVLENFNKLMKAYIMKKRAMISIGKDENNEQFNEISQCIKDYPDSWFIEYLLETLKKENGKTYKPEVLLDYTNEGLNKYKSYCFLVILKTIRYVSGLCKLPPSR